MPCISRHIHADIYPVSFKRIAAAAFSQIPLGAAEIAYLGIMLPAGSGRVFQPQVFFISGLSRPCSVFIVFAGLIFFIIVLFDFTGLIVTAALIVLPVFTGLTVLTVCSPAGRRGNCFFCAVSSGTGAGRVSTVCFIRGLTVRIIPSVDGDILLYPKNKPLFVSGTNSAYMARNAGRGQGRQ